MHSINKMPLVTLILLHHHDRLPATTSGLSLAHGTPAETLREAAQALRDWLERLDRERVGQLAACYIDHATHLLDDEAITLVANKPGDPESSGSRMTLGSDESDLG